MKSLGPEVSEVSLLAQRCRCIHNQVNASVHTKSTCMAATASISGHHLPQAARDRAQTTGRQACAETCSLQPQTGHESKVAS